LLLIAGSAAAVVFALCPALWVAPVKVLSRLWIGLNREVDINSAVMFLGKTRTTAIPAAIYPAFALFLLTPEALLPAIVGLPQLLERRGTTRQMLLGSMCVTLPFVILIITQAHVSQRYLLPVVPCLVLISGLVVEHWFGPARKRHWAFVVVPALALLGLRVHRAERLHPLPITYCSTWLGLDCGEVFHLGWGEGLKEAALRVRSEIEPKTPNVPITIFGSGYAGSMAVWTPVRRVTNIEEAELLVDYICDWQRQGKAATDIASHVSEKRLSPVFEVKLGGRSTVRVYPGPQFRGRRSADHRPSS
jgi:hypothetical protein